ncbi:MAG: hypothetical protein HY816_22425 [Candidatus Wallbacteria bacterium]|nr:hypothetical protein [Candidatus Wallbacteria bacterium]
MLEEIRKNWFVRALIALGVVAALIGVILPLLVDSPPYPEGRPAPARSLLDRMIGR